MPIRKVKDEIYVLENGLLCDLGYYIINEHPDIIRKFIEWHKEGLRKRNEE